ncbi:hypothetical protein IB276_18410 [Ensifer sp. ENS04]|uniref:OmpA family protein n=1 Tax=Ensifer sp. ENS04 TaxID=2769281 RepID=UPI00177ACF37|nr:OmpA family protein [Ensifer sp. ENS04]MBD9541430.1 hypothetical protein [Ensifer sp. ENS04]
MSVQGTSVTGEQRGYGRGLILGLTMAESMLLLVFCLLLATGAIILNEKKQTKEAIAGKVAAEEKQREQEKDLALLEEDLATAGGLDNSPVSPKEWRELYLTHKKLQKSGLTLDAVAANADAIKIVVDEKLTADEVADAHAVTEKLLQHGVDAETFNELVPVAKSVLDGDVRPEMIAEIKKSGLTPEEIAKVVALLGEMNATPDELAELSETITVLRSEVLDATSDTLPSEQLRAILAKAEAYDADQAGNAPPHEWPPIINLSETKDYFFTSGSAELSPKFEQVLREGVAKQIASTAKGYNVDVIEVIGHTDEQRMGKRPSNMDFDLKDVLAGTVPASTLKPADNAGLGLARAIAVADVLSRDPNLKGMSILPMSGAQLILPGDRLTDGAQSGDVSSRRRIEIRVRKRNLDNGARKVDEMPTTPAAATDQLPSNGANESQHRGGVNPYPHSGLF